MDTFVAQAAPDWLNLTLWVRMLNAQNEPVLPARRLPPPDPDAITNGCWTPTFDVSVPQACTVDHLELVNGTTGRVMLRREFSGTKYLNAGDILRVRIFLVL